MKKTVIFTLVFLLFGAPSGEFSLGEMFVSTATADGPLYVKGGQFIVSSVTRREGWPRVAYGSDGSFLAVWIKFGKGGNQNVLGQLIARDGTFIGSQIPIAKEREEIEGFPHLAYSSGSGPERCSDQDWRRCEGDRGRHSLETMR